MSIPVDALNPDAVSVKWHRSFEWHLDALPPLMDTLISMTLPLIPVSRGGSRFDKPQVTGGGYVDNIPIDSWDVTTEGDMVAKGATADATEVWAWVVAYTRAVAEWIIPTRPAPVLNDKPNADPLSARAVALITIGWLIDHADQIEPVTELDEHREVMFTLIRHLRGRYGVHQHPRRLRPARCRTCGERAVVVDWVDAPNGSPKPVRAGVCRNCHQVYTEGDAA